MKTTEYLYQIPPSMLKDIPYEEALIAKINGADVVLRKILEQPLMVRDLKRVKDTCDAIEHNRKLLEELNTDIVKRDIDVN